MPTNEELSPILNTIGKTFEHAVKQRRQRLQVEELQEVRKWILNACKGFINNLRLEFTRLDGDFPCSTSEVTQVWVVDSDKSLQLFTEELPHRLDRYRDECIAHLGKFWKACGFTYAIEWVDEPVVKHDKFSRLRLPRYGGTPQNQHIGVRISFPDDLVSTGVIKKGIAFGSEFEREIVDLVESLWVNMGT